MGINYCCCKLIWYLKNKYIKLFFPFFIFPVTPQHFSQQGPRKQLAINYGHSKPTAKFQSFCNIQTSMLGHSDFDSVKRHKCNVIMAYIIYNAYAGIRIPHLSIKIQNHSTVEKILPWHKFKKEASFSDYLLFG